MNHASTTISPAEQGVIVQTRTEELANVWTHGLGLLLSIAGAIVMCWMAAVSGGMTRMLSVAVFCFGLILVYFASTAFHLAGVMRWDASIRNRWRLLDHAAIYVLIAGSYTPVMLIAVGGTWGWAIFGVVWFLAVTGVTFKTLMVGRYDRFDKLDTMLYLAMGWLCLVAVGPIWASLTLGAFVWLTLGGVFYSTGCIFFLWERLPFNHAIWHCFVMGGSACHFMMVLLYVAMLPVGAMAGT